MRVESLNKNPHLGFLNNIEWMNAQASEIFISVNDRNHPELPVLSASQELGMIYRDEGGMNIFHDVANEITYKRVKPGQFVIHLRSFQGGFAHSKVEGITSPAYTILDFKDRNKHNDLFWKYVLTSEEFIKRLELITYGIRDGRSINFSDFSTLKFHFPSYEVQQKIGAFLSHVDSLIQAKTKKLESLKAVKKSLLQKCFPKAGEKVPEMRFAGFKGEWEEKKLGEFCKLFGRIGFRGYTEKDLVKEGEGAITLSPSNIVDGIMNYSKCTYISWYKYEESPEIKINNGDILLVKTGSTFGKTALVTNLPCEATINPQFVVIKNIKIDNIFLSYLLSHDLIQNQINSTVVGGAIPTMSQEVIKNFNILIPSATKEQQKIGHFFSKYDSLISAQQKEIDKLKDIKKSLLQKMFV
ncbi:restriction endonuclease subunit S [Treponema berlinense]|uniref:restriction endonuclease subunit S n=1 Tax=Treponema berlinense TaxID=225004 RepID=UPI0026EF68C2|nr:restriction endonuclease subunit S [Treponema berlinense]